MFHQPLIQCRRRQRPDPADEHVAVSMGLLAWLEATGGGYRDRDIGRSSDNRARILSKAGGPEQPCHRQEAVPAVFDQRRARQDGIIFGPEVGFNLNLIEAVDLRAKVAYDFQARELGWDDGILWTGLGIGVGF